MQVPQCIAWSQSQSSQIREQVTATTDRIFLMHLDFLPVGRVGREEAEPFVSGSLSHMKLHSGQDVASDLGGTKHCELPQLGIFVVAQIG